MAEATFRLTVAIPASLKPKLDDVAAREHRSLNRQIVMMLEKALVKECSATAHAA